MTRPIDHFAWPTSARIPAHAGVCLKPQHYADILTQAPRIGFFEVHAENYMGAGGPPHRYLTYIRERYPLSLHGVGLSIGGNGPLDREHLARLRKLVRRYEPGLFSEHLAWSTHESAFLNDLLPVPYNAESLARIADHIDEIQTALGRRMLLENPSTYIAFEASTMSETEFLAELVRRTGCGLLLDVSNVHVSAVNHGHDPFVYLDSFPTQHVGEIHLAGFAADRDDEGELLLIDAHDSAVADTVWRLYEHAVARTGPVPTLIEWDNEVPEFPVLLAEAGKAERVLARAPSGRAPASTG